MILITGASGLVGEAIFEKFRREFNVIGTCCTAEDDRFTSVDLTDTTAVRNIFHTCDIEYVIHCAVARPSEKVDTISEELYVRNMMMTFNLLENINEEAKFINIGTTAIYNLEGSQSLSEESEQLCQSFYQLSKRHCEESLKLYFVRNRKLLNIRISSPYSVKRSSDTVLYRFIADAVEKKCINIWGSGRRKQAFTNVHTFADDLFRVFQSCYGNFNYVTEKGISMLELAELVENAAEGVEIRKLKKSDPEEQCRTTISTEKISSFIMINNTIQDDIASIVRSMQ